MAKAKKGPRQQAALGVESAQPQAPLEGQAQGMEEQCLGRHRDRDPGGVDRKKHEKRKKSRDRSASGRRPGKTHAQPLADLPVQSTKKVLQPLAELPTQAAQKVLQPLAELPAQAAKKVLQPLAVSRAVATRQQFPKQPTWKLATKRQRFCMI